MVYSFIRAPLLHVGAHTYRSLFASLRVQDLIGAPVGITCASLPHVGAPMASEASLLYIQASPLLRGGAPVAFIGLFGMWAHL